MRARSAGTTRAESGRKSGRLGFGSTTERRLDLLSGCGEGADTIMEGARAKEAHRDGAMFGSGARFGGQGRHTPIDGLQHESTAAQDSESAAHAQRQHGHGAKFAFASGRERAAAKGSAAAERCEAASENGVVPKGCESRGAPDAVQDQTLIKTSGVCALQRSNNGVSTSAERTDEDKNYRFLATTSVYSTPTWRHPDPTVRQALVPNTRQPVFGVVNTTTGLEVTVLEQGSFPCQGGNSSPDHSPGRTQGWQTWVDKNGTPSSPVGLAARQRGNSAHFGRTTMRLRKGRQQRVGERWHGARKTAGNAAVRASSALRRPLTAHAALATEHPGKTTTRRLIRRGHQQRRTQTSQGNRRNLRNSNCAVTLHSEQHEASPNAVWSTARASNQGVTEERIDSSYEDSVRNHQAGTNCIDGTLSPCSARQEAQHNGKPAQEESAPCSVDGDEVARVEHNTRNAQYSAHSARSFGSFEKGSTGGIGSPCEMAQPPNQWTFAGRQAEPSVFVRQLGRGNRRRQRLFRLQQTQAS